MIKPARPASDLSGMHPAADVPKQPGVLDQVEKSSLSLDSLGASVERTERLALLGTLTGMIAHEFNNLMTPIAAYGRMALDARPDDPIRDKALFRAIECAERAGQICAAILELARAEPGTTGTVSPQPGGAAASAQPMAGPARPAHAIIADAVRAALHCLARDPSKDGIALELSIPRGMAVAVRSVIVQQIVLNLVLNARRALIASMRGHAPIIDPALPAGQSGVGGRGASGGALRIEASGIRVPEHAMRSNSTWNERGEWVQIVVSDTGVGMTEPQLRCVVQPRMPGAVETSTGAGAGLVHGSGLGALITHRLVADVRGFVWGVSVPGGGTSIGVVLPAAV
ncbi:MAG: hypothetical protein C0475_07610 [Planctomyces sp.]|nr:hypothetical protein [Planctomyces sp.]